MLEFKGKKQDNPVTALDRDTETFLRTELRAAFPDHGLLGEEHADDIAADASYVWVIDPIDGTMNFASGLPLFGHLDRAAARWGAGGRLHLGAGRADARAGRVSRPGRWRGAWFDDQPVRVSRPTTSAARSWRCPAGICARFAFAGRGRTSRGQRGRCPMRARRARAPPSWC